MEISLVDRLEINLDGVSEGLKLLIDARKPHTLSDAGDSASEHFEARYQLTEGCFYEYELNDNGYKLGDVGDNIVQARKRTPHMGILAPNIFVGMLSIPILNIGSGLTCGSIELEVQSVKMGYRDDYLNMLRFITEKSTDLLLQANSPVIQHIEIDYMRDSETLYQRFAFVQSVIGSMEFAESVHRIITSPVTRWTESWEERDIRNVGRMSQTDIKQIISRGRRTAIPVGHHLSRMGLYSLPQSIRTTNKADTLDASENSFVKQALEDFLKICSDVNQSAVALKGKGAATQRLIVESKRLMDELEGHLHHSFFREISKADRLNLNSPVLQRKEGYREVLRAWLMMSLAARLIWKGGDDVYGGQDVYKAGKKDVAILYEYWLFFKLLDLCQSMFQLEPKGLAELFQSTDDGLNLHLRQGTPIAFEGKYEQRSRNLHVRFSYNRMFSGPVNRPGDDKPTYPKEGSWSTTLRPDYTLSLWPFGISEFEAERQELIVHIHFDAKYKIANLKDSLSAYEPSTEEDDQDSIFLLDDMTEKSDHTNAVQSGGSEKLDNRKGIYKNADLLKMHAYKDAIRRTGGAYVLYPGDALYRRKGFHEIIPGLGAFPVRPSHEEQDIRELRNFIEEVVNHITNRTSHREKIALRTYQTYDSFTGDELVTEPLPESYNNNRDLLPDETYVLVGYFRSSKHLDWIQGKGLYNFRMESENGSLVLDSKTVGAKYILLYTGSERNSSRLYKIKSQGPKVYSSDGLAKLGYPEPTRANYLVFKVTDKVESEFRDVSWSFRDLPQFELVGDSGRPITTKLTELMRTVNTTTDASNH